MYLHRWVWKSKESLPITLIVSDSNIGITLNDPMLDLYSSWFQEAIDSLFSEIIAGYENVILNNIKSHIQKSDQDLYSVHVIKFFLLKYEKIILKKFCRELKFFLENDASLIAKVKSRFDGGGKYRSGGDWVYTYEWSDFLTIDYDDNKSIGKYFSPIFHERGKWVPQKSSSDEPYEITENIGDISESEVKIKIPEKVRLEYLLLIESYLAKISLLNYTG